MSLKKGTDGHNWPGGKEGGNIKWSWSHNTDSDDKMMLNYCVKSKPAKMTKWWTGGGSDS